MGTLIIGLVLGVWIFFMAAVLYNKLDEIDKRIAELEEDEL